MPSGQIVLSIYNYKRADLCATILTKTEYEVRILRGTDRGIVAMRNVRAQDIAVKTNLLYDACATINIGAEVGLAPKWTLDVSGNLNAWTLSHGRKWKHWMAQPEARYWFCDRFAGHFLAVHALGGQYNVT